jgi:hypothetical protein
MLAVFLGASEYLHLPPERSSPAFLRSHEKFKAYVCDAADGLGIPPGNVLNLFDEEVNTSQFETEVERFLNSHAGVKDVLVHYTGHGDRTVDRKFYYLCLKNTRPGSPLTTGIPVDVLKSALRGDRPGLRVYLIIDACLAGRAVDVYQSEQGGTAAEQFFRDLPQEGISLLCSASRDRLSIIPGGGEYTLFGEALDDALTKGDPEAEPLLNLHDVHRLTSRYIATRYPNERDRHPEIHSPRQEAGIIAQVRLFPNPARRRGHAEGGDWAPPLQSAFDANTLHWCAILSEGGQGSAAHKVLRERLSEFPSAAARLKTLTRKSALGPPREWPARSLCAAPPAFLQAVAEVSRCELALFDLTGFEPAVMLLLGVRAVARRGVTICLCRKDAAPADAELPFFLKDVNLFRYAATDARLELALRDRAIAGFTHLLQWPDQYLDLPAFDAVRYLPPDREHRTPIGYDKQVLVLCPFEESYLQRFREKMGPSMENALSAQFGEDADLLKRGTLPDPQLIRTLDILSPRLVSQGLFEAIRLTDLSLVDWTMWSPSVFFELGARLAANERPPVCLLEAAGPEPKASGNPDRTPLRQREGLLRLFRPYVYSPSPTAPGALTEQFQNLLGWYRKLHQGAAGAPADTPEAAGGWWFAREVHDAVWRAVDPRGEPAVRPVEEFLQTAAEPLLADEDGRPPRLLYPPQHELTGQAVRAGRERLLAAWLYLHHRSKARPELRPACQRLAPRLITALADSADQADRELVEYICRWSAEPST